MNHHLLLIIHLICATIWVGGHLYLVIAVLPGVLKKREPTRLLAFEKSFEPLGIPALALLVITGWWMASQFGVRVGNLLAFSSPIERVVSLKIILLLATVLLALSAQIRVLPKLQTSPKKLPEMTAHAIAVTLLGIAMLVLGSFVRYGGI